MEKHIAVIPGDGIGPEVTTQAQKALNAVATIFGHSFTYEEGLLGACAIDATGSPFPDETLKLLQNCDAILFGAIGDPRFDNDPSAKVRPEQGLLAMRKALGLYANVRPVKSYPLLYNASPLKESIIANVDFVVFRELTSGIYFGSPRGRSESGDTAFDTCTYTKEEILRVSKFAFEAATKRGGKVTLVDKANVLATSRLWRETVSEWAQQAFPQVELTTMFVDNAAMKIIQNPSAFDVVLTENMFGDILTDEASVITGSLGMLPSASLGDAVHLFEPIHGSFPEAAGKNMANPLGAILSAAMLLDYSFNMQGEARAIREAVEVSLSKGKVTSDIDSTSTLGTTEVGDFIANTLLQHTPSLI
ncbi:MAG: 3-isopropylmalate dehydrogenase [Bacteroidota bacterium]